MTRQPESVLKTAINNAIDSTGAYRVPVPEGSSGSRVGAPDIVVCASGVFIGLEVKTTTGSRSHRQVVAEQEITRAGGVYAVIRSADEAKAVIEQTMERMFRLRYSNPSNPTKPVTQE